MKHFFHKKELPTCPTNKQKANSLTVFNVSFEGMNHLTIIDCKILSTDFIDQTKKEYNTFEISCFPWRLERSKKSSEIRLFFAANDFVFFQL